MINTETSVARLVALVPAAGIGVRAAAPGTEPLAKQYRLIAGRPLLWHAVNALLRDPRIDEVRVAVVAGDTEAARVLDGLPRTVIRPCGGVTRADTVLQALRDAHLEAHDWALVHDAARPGLPADALARLIDACWNHPVGGLLALPVADTIKRATVQEADTQKADTQKAGTHAQASAKSPHQTGHGDAQRDCVDSTVSRAGLWSAQTPQMFRAGALHDALARALLLGLEITDESSALEATGVRPLLVRGSSRNAKVTWPEDFDWVGSWL